MQYKFLPVTGGFLCCCNSLFKVVVPLVSNRSYSDRLNAEGTIPIIIDFKTFGNAPFVQFGCYVRRKCAAADGDVHLTLVFIKDILPKAEYLVCNSCLCVACWRPKASACYVQVQAYAAATYFIVGDRDYR